MQLFNKITAETTILTPNRRLSATLLKNHQVHAKNLSKKAWLSPDILPYNTWIQRLWDNYHLRYMDNPPLVLTSQQEIALWETVLHASEKQENLLNTSATAELAKAAWSILQQWEIPLTTSILTTTEDGEAFVRWGKHFLKTCEEKNFIDSSGIPQKIIEYLIAKKICLPKKIFIVGFTEFSPQQKNLFQLCETLGTDIQYVETLIEKPLISAYRLSLADEETEIMTMAKWSLKISQEHSDARIGCIIPNLEDTRDRVQQIFGEVYAEGQLHDLESIDSKFNISAGKNLANYAITNAALRLLSLSFNQFSLDDLSFILHSPFIGDAEKERLARANYDARLRQTHLPSKILQKIMDPQDKFFIAHSCPRLNSRIKQFFEKKQTLDKYYFLHDWAQSFLNLLTLLGWPGERSLNSPEYQVVQRWLNALFDFRSFNQVLGKQNFSEALRTLSLLTQKTVFQPETSDARVQVLGLLEAAGLPFDYTWVMGLDDLTWPPAAKPNPFLPRQLQKTLAMPHANAERELHYSKRLTDQLIKSTSHIIFSYADIRNDAELRPSSIISHLPVITLQALSLPASLTPAEVLFHSRDLENYQDDQAPVLSSDYTSGGSFILKYQAACPFKAFAEIRLNAKRLERPQLGLRAKDRGTILHKALEIIWQDLKDSETLKKILDEELVKVVKTAVHHALKKIVGEEIDTLRLYILESQRMQQLILNWLALEKKRPSFKVIAQEKEFQIKLKDLTLKARIDRIDQLSDGSYFIIDYKTGKVNQISTWFGERPDEPQLPLYFMAHRDVTSAIAFGEIHAENISFKGLARDDNDIKNLRLLSDLPFADQKNWSDQLNFWQTNFEKIAADFLSGQAAVMPKHPTTCQYCHLQTLCRIHERE